MRYDEDIEIDPSFREERERAAKAEAKEAKSSRSSSTKKSVLATVLGTAVTYFAKTLATQMARKITGGTIRTTTKKKTTKRKK